jgi:hypothetical protein
MGPAAAKAAGPPAASNPRDDPVHCRNVRRLVRAWGIVGLAKNVVQ